MKKISPGSFIIQKLIELMEIIFVKYTCDNFSSKWLWGSCFIFFRSLYFLKRKKYSIRIYEFKGISLLKYSIFWRAYPEICLLPEILTARISRNIQNIRFE